MDNPYLEVISYVERLHRQFLEVVKLELEGLRTHDINNVQAMILFNIGDSEMTVGELTLRGCYLGSNVSYNVKKMVENEYLAHERSVHDQRAIHIRWTEKGIKLRDSLTKLPVRKGGYAFDCWTPEEGFSCGYTYGRIEDAHYARKVEIRSRNNVSSDRTIACSTFDEFVRLTI